MTTGENQAENGMYDRIEGALASKFTVERRCQLTQLGRAARLMGARIEVHGGDDDRRKPSRMDVLDLRRR